jgi:hypothetical protein
MTLEAFCSKPRRSRRSQVGKYGRDPSQLRHDETPKARFFAQFQPCISNETLSMSFHLRQSRMSRIEPALFAGMLAHWFHALAQYAVESPFACLSGSWTGGGTITLINGSSERIRCQGSYSVNAAGNAARQNFRCASGRYKLDFISNVVFAGAALRRAGPNPRLQTRERGALHIPRVQTRRRISAVLA